MRMFRSKKTKTEYITPESYKDWSNAGYEIEGIGRRLDAVRGTMSDIKDKDSWAYRHWATIEARMTQQWKLTIMLKDTGMKQIKREDNHRQLDYSWWEPSTEIGVRMPVFDFIGDWLNQKFGFVYNDLDGSWEKAKEEKLQKARQGLA